MMMLVAAGCSKEDPAAEQQGTQLTEQMGEPRAVKIAVTETGWQSSLLTIDQTGQTTRAGETLEELKNNSERTWDFTKTPGVDLNVLKADAAGALAKWEANDAKTEFSNISAMNGTLQANGVALYMAEGLTFSNVPAKTEESIGMRIDINRRLLLNSKDICITLPSLEKGQKVTVRFSSTGSNSRNIIPGGSVSPTAAVVSSSTTPVECTVTMTANGSPTFTVGTGTDGNAVYIYSISVTRAESDGFGLYSSSNRLKVINSHIVWDSDIQSWKGISNDAYLMLWPNNTIDKAGIAFTAYAPYIDDESLTPTPTEGIISRDANSVVFKPISDNRIDLMYAEHTTSADGVVQLNFKHALGKLSVGTISNNYGEDITLTQIRLSSTHFCKKGTLDLSTGNWTVEDVNTNYTETYNSTALAALFGSLAIPDKGFLTFPKDVAYTQIPGTVMTFEYTFTTANNTFTVSKEMTVVKGENIFININIGQNHEVVIE